MPRVVTTPFAFCPQQYKYSVISWVVLDPLTHTGPAYPHRTHLPTQGPLICTGPTYPLGNHLSHSARNSTSTSSSAGWCWTHLPTQDWPTYPHRTHLPTQDPFTHRGLTYPHTTHLPTQCSLGCDRSFETQCSHICVQFNLFSLIPNTAEPLF